MTTYNLLGFIPELREDNRDLSPEQQRSGQRDEVVYSTDDRDEAEQLRNAGGFFRDGLWIAVTGYREVEPLSDEEIEKGAGADIPDSSEPLRKGDA